MTHAAIAGISLATGFVLGAAIVGLLTDRRKN